MDRALKVNHFDSDGDPVVDMIVSAGSFDQENGTLMVYTDRAGGKLYKAYAPGMWATAEWVAR